MRKTIVIVTQKFPFLPGEEFLETEIKFYERYADIVNFIIVPLNAFEGRYIGLRHVDKRFLVNLSISQFNKRNLLLRIKSLGRAVPSYEFLREFAYVLSSNRFLSTRLFRLFSASSLVYLYMQLFSELIRDCFHGDRLSDLVFYTYWYDAATYALQILKRKYGFKLVTRVHRVDVYEEANPGFYIPLRRQFITDIDKIFVITPQGKEYIKRRFSCNVANIELARLGVFDRKITTKPSSENSFVIVSCSYLRKVKNVDKIIDALAELSAVLREVSIEWFHIGDGPLFNSVKAYAHRRLSNLGNIKYNFLGYMHNKNIFDFYKKNNIDVFLNLSSSEGVPVSIMEAMSCGIPIVAPDVGGVGDMIANGKTGFLLSSSPSLSEVVNVLKNMRFFKSENIRINSYRLFSARFDAEKNYEKFINGLLNL